VECTIRKHLERNKKRDIPSSWGQPEKGRIHEICLKAIMALEVWSDSQVT
jgi:hypothetical protein